MTLQMNRCNCISRALERCDLQFMTNRLLAPPSQHAYSKHATKQHTPGRSHLLSTSAAAASTTEQLPGTAPALRNMEKLLWQASLPAIAQGLWSTIVRPGDVCVDATCGNGHDTVFLAHAVGHLGKITAFDVQQSALDSATAALEAALPPEARPYLDLRLMDHSRMGEVVEKGTARLVCFNLGYLPGGDKSLTTTVPTTLAAVSAACEVLAPGGMLSVLCYVGHPGGKEELSAVKAAMEQLSRLEWVTSQMRLLNRPGAPVLLLAVKQPET